jgi:hypothetical protein
VLFDVCVDRGMQGFDAPMDATPDLALRRKCEESLDLIEP